MSGRAFILFMWAALTAGCHSYLPPVQAAEDIAKQLNLRPSEVGAPAVVLNDEVWISSRFERYRFFTHERYYRRTYILDRRGLYMANLQVPYGVGIEIESVNGRLTCPGGEITVFDESDVLHTHVGRSNGDDHHLMVFSLPRAEPGCIVEYAVEQESADYTVWQVYRLRPQVPVRSASFHVELVNIDGLLETRGGGGFVETSPHHWEAHDVPSDERELFAAPFSTRRPWVEVVLRIAKMSWRTDYYYRTWNTVAQAAWSEARTFLSDRGSLSNPPARDPETLVRLAWNELQAQVAHRDGDERPSDTAASVLAGGHGTANQRAFVLLSWLRRWGLEADLAVLGDRDAPEIRDDFPSPNLDRYLVRVPVAHEAWVWLDPSCQGCGVDELGIDNQGRNALLIPVPRDLRSPGLRAEATIVRLPESAHDREPPTLSLRMRVDERGLVTTSGGLTARGYLAALLRVPSGRSVPALKELGTLLGGLPPKKDAVPTDSRGEPLALEIGERVLERHELTQTQSWIAVPIAAASPQPWMGALEPDRATPVYLYPPPHFDHDFRLAVPDGYTVVHLPPAVNEHSPFGSYTLQVEAAHGEVRVRESLRFTTRQVEVRDYAAFHRFIETVRIAREASIALHQQPPSP